MKSYLSWLNDEKPTDNEINDSVKCLRCGNKATSDDLVVFESLAYEYACWKFPDYCRGCRNEEGERRQERRGEAISHFSKNKHHPICVICGNDNMDELQFDHIYGRKEDGRIIKPTPKNMYKYG